MRAGSRLTGGIAAAAIAAMAATAAGIADDAVGAPSAGVRLADGRMKKGLDNGKLPLTSITAANIRADGPGTATADVTASSPVLDPHTVNIKFVDQEGWKLAHSSLTMLSKMSSN